MLLFAIAVSALQAALLPNSPPYSFGEIVALCGDLNGDRHSEFAIGGVGSDDILIFNGNDGRLFRGVGPTTAGQYLSGGFTRTSDVDGDRVDDMAISFVGAKSSSWVEVRSGKTGALVRRLDALEDEIRLGAGLSNIGDVDRDGVDDLVLSAFYPDEVNEWRGIRWLVVSGADGHRRQSVEWHGTYSHGGITSRDNPAATRLGDVNGDGVPDFAVLDDLLVRVHSGARVETIHKFPLPRQHAKRGARYVVCGECDFDCDGRSDIVIGTPYVGFDDRVTTKDVLRIFSGRTGALLRILNRPGDRAGLGYGIVPAQVSAKTGVPDLWVTQHNPFGYGLYRVSADGSELELRSGSFMDDDYCFGYSMAGGADVDADGVSDIIVSCFSPFSASLSRNGAHVFSGRDGRQIHEITRSSDRDAIRPR